MKTISFFVSGEPQPFPKKASNRKTGMIYTHDPSGHKRGWMQAIAATARESLHEHGLEPFGENDPIYIKMVFYRTKPKSWPKKHLLPHKKPDLDNFGYAVSNALNGVCYWDDSRIVAQVMSKEWADEVNPSGVDITIKLAPVLTW